MKVPTGIRSVSARTPPTWSRWSVSDDHEIDLLQLGFLGGGDDAFGIAPAVARPSGIHQQALTGGRNDEGGLPTFNVNEKHLEVFLAAAAGNVRARERTTAERARILLAILSQR